MYAMSKHGLVGLSTSLGQNVGGEVDVSVVLPGLVDTPFTWNQARGYVVQNDTLVPNPVAKQPFQTWQCVNGDGTVVLDGDCADGGSGYTCPCPDLKRSERRVELISELMLSSQNLTLDSLLSPNAIASEILDLLWKSRSQAAVHGENGASASTVVVPNDANGDRGSNPPMTRLCPDTMWLKCPVDRP